jgi:hypothetical protein
VPEFSENGSQYGICVGVRIRKQFFILTSVLGGVVSVPTQLFKELRGRITRGRERNLYFIFLFWFFIPSPVHYIYKRKGREEALGLARWDKWRE